MYSMKQRGNNILAFGVSCSLALIAACAIASLFFPNTTDVETSVNSVRLDVHVDYFSRQQTDRGYFQFDLDVDLVPLFHWNVKQLFLYLVIEYENEEAGVNQVVVWDKIVRYNETRQAKELHLRNEKPKYIFFDSTKTLRGRNATLKLEWNSIPFTGFLTYSQQATPLTKIEFPTTYWK